MAVVTILFIHIPDPDQFEHVIRNIFSPLSVESIQIQLVKLSAFIEPGEPVDTLGKSRSPISSVSSKFSSRLLGHRVWLCLIGSSLMNLNLIAIL
jgi:hypothetical protein